MASYQRRLSVGTWAMVAVASVMPVSAANTWDAGGVADTNWSTPANWDDNNVPASGANVTFGTGGAAANVDTNAVVGTLTLNRAVAFALNAGGGTLTLNAGLTKSNNQNHSVAAPISVGGPNTWNTVNNTLTVSGAVSGPYPVAVLFPGGSGVSSLTLSGDNSAFAGGFSFRTTWTTTTDNANKTLAVTATTANALGSGASTVDYDTNVDLAHGSLTAGGRLQVKPYGQVRLSGAIDAADTFTVLADGILSGGATQLGGLSRGGNLTLARNAVIGHHSLSQTTAASLGTAADLLFGVSSDFTAASSRGFGAGTPWRGIAAGELLGVRAVTQGTFSIDTTGLDEFVLNSFPFTHFSNISTYGLRLSSSAGALAFNLASGSPVPARVNGLVHFDAASPTFGAFSGFTVSDAATLRAIRAGCLGATPLPVALASGTLRIDAVHNAANLAVSAGDLTVGGRGMLPLVAQDATSKFASLTANQLLRAGKGTLRVSSTTASLNSQNQIKFTTAPTLQGKSGAPADQTILAPWTVSSDSYGDFLTYDANGVKVASYSGTDVTAANAGELISQGANAAVSGTRSLYGLKLYGTAANVTVSGGTLKLGVLSDSPTEVRASQAGLILSSTAANNSRTHTISSAIDLGTSELAAYVVSYVLNSQGVLSGNVTGTGGLTKFGTGLLRLTGAANALSGDVTVWDGIVQVNGGNGFDSAASLYVGPYGTFDLGNVTGNTETFASVAGLGTLKIATGKTVAVTGTLTAGTAAAPLTVTTGGTVSLGSTAKAVFDLDYRSEPKTTARLAMTASALNLASGASVKIGSLANAPSGFAPVTFTLISYGTLVGTFSSNVECPAGVTGSLVYDGVSKQIKVTLEPQSVGTVLLVK